MLTLTDRVARYLLARLRRRAIHDIYERAAEVSLLETAFIDQPNEAGLVWHLAATPPLALSDDTEVAREQISRRLRQSTRSSASSQRQDSLFIPDDVPRSMPKHRRESERRSTPVEGAESRGKTTPTGGKKVGPETGSSETQSRSSPFERDRVLRILRTMAPSPSATDVAVALMLARAVGVSVGGLDDLMTVLRQPDPMIVVRVPLDGFEERLGKLLEGGMVVPKPAPQADGFGQHSLSGSYRDVPARTPRIVTFGGLALREKSDVALRSALARARAFEQTPILIADESTEKLPTRIVAAADLILELAHIDRSLIAELLHICAGVTPKASFAAMSRVGLDPRGLGLDDFMLAIRPGRSGDRIVDILKALGKGGRQDETDSGDDEKKTKSDKGKSTKNTSKASVSFDFSEPEGPVMASRPDDRAIGHRDHIRIETLSGFGAATTWAYDLKADLPLWRNKQLAWSDMSTRLLLSGPPGTGKTTFAQALRNSLGVPLLATSVAHWLEPGYLGDVLKTMTAAFEAAKARAPCILFLDELDNIGSRGGGGQHSDYWDTLINRLLELLDGSSRADGVVVVCATNQAERIDKALLRSGRLETHVKIEFPNTDALAGILVHHLGTELDHVVATRPNPEAIEHRVSRPQAMQSGDIPNNAPTNGIEFERRPDGGLA
jgi:hypothetical protein